MLDVQQTGGFWAPEHDLAEHLISLEQEAWGDGQAERLGSLEMEDQLELHGAFHGQVGGLGGLEDLIHVCCGSNDKLYNFFTALLQLFYDSG